MFDNLRDDASDSFYDDEETPDFLNGDFDSSPDVDSIPSQTKKSSKLLGMTDIQRFIIAVMLMIAVCTLGAMCLLITGKISLV